MTVSKTAEAGPLKGATVYILVQCDDWKGNRNPLSPPGAGYLEDEIVTALASTGISRTFEDGKTDLKVDCHYRNGWCLPYMGRHLDVFVSSIRTVRIHLIDCRANRIIGEVEYTSATMKRPAKGFVQEMVRGMVRDSQ